MDSESDAAPKETKNLDFWALWGSLSITRKLCLVAAVDVLFFFWGFNKFDLDMGGLIGAGIGVVAAVGIAARQFEKEDSRHNEEQSKQQIRLTAELNAITTAAADQVKATNDLWLKQVAREETRACRLLIEYAADIEQFFWREVPRALRRTAETAADLIANENEKARLWLAQAAANLDRIRELGGWHYDSAVVRDMALTQYEIAVALVKQLQAPDRQNAKPRATFLAQRIEKTVNFSATAVDIRKALNEAQLEIQSYKDTIKEKVEVETGLEPTSDHGLSEFEADCDVLIITTNEFDRALAATVLSAWINIGADADTYPAQFVDNLHLFNGSRREIRRRFHELVENWAANPQDAFQLPISDTPYQGMDRLLKAFGAATDTFSDLANGYVDTCFPFSYCVPVREIDAQMANWVTAFDQFVQHDISLELPPRALVTLLRLQRKMRLGGYDLSAEEGGYVSDRAFGTQIERIRDVLQETLSMHMYAVDAITPLAALTSPTIDSQNPIRNLAGRLVGLLTGIRTRHDQLFLLDEARGWHPDWMRP